MNPRYSPLMNFGLIFFSTILMLIRASVRTDDHLQILGDIDEFRDAKFGFFGKSGSLGNAFDTKVNEYFKTNFSNGGLEYLRKLKIRLDHFRLFDFLKGKNLNHLLHEIQAIVGSEKLNQVRFRIHRFLAILDSAATIGQVRRELLSPSVNYHTVFGSKSDRKALGQFVAEVKDHLVSQDIVIVDFCLRLVGFVSFDPKMQRRSIAENLVDIQGAISTLIQKYPHLKSDTNNLIMEGFFLNYSDPQTRNYLTRKIQKLMAYFSLENKWSSTFATCEIPKRFERIRKTAQSIVQEKTDFVTILGTDCESDCCAINPRASVFSTLKRVECSDTCDSLKDDAMQLAIGVADRVPDSDIVKLTQNVPAFQGDFLNDAKRFDTWVSWVVRENFGEGGIAFLNWIRASLDHDKLTNFDEARIRIIKSEMKRIVDEEKQQYTYRLHCCLSGLYFLSKDVLQSIVISEQINYQRTRVIEMIHDFWNQGGKIPAAIEWALKFTIPFVLFEDNHSHSDIAQEALLFAWRIVGMWDKLRDKESLAVENLSLSSTTSLGKELNKLKDKFFNQLYEIPR